MPAQDALFWMQIISSLVARGEVVFEKVRTIYAAKLGKTPEELTAEENARLDVVLGIIATYRAEAQAIAEGRS